MASPHDEAWGYADAADLLQEQYWPELTEESPGRFGRDFNKFFKPSMEQIGGDGKTMQVELAPGDTVRFDRNMLGAITAPDAFEADKIKVRWSEVTPASNDFSRVTASCQTTLATNENGGRGSIVDFCDRMYNQIMPEFDEALAIHRNLDRTARLATVSGTPKQADNPTFSLCTATPTNATGARFVIANGSISMFRRGRRVDIYSSVGALRIGNARVTSVNVADNSVAIEFGSGNSQAVRNSTAGAAQTLGTIVSGDYIYMSGEKDAGMYSAGAYFSYPSSGDSFIGGVNRLTAANNWLIPVSTRAAESSNAILTKSMIDDLAVAMQYQQEEEKGVVFVSTPKLIQKLRNEYTEAAFLNIPDGDNRLKRFANFGSIGLNYQHPSFGLVKVMSDVLASPNALRVYCPEEWRSLYYGHRGLKLIKEGTPGNGWYRVTDSAPNSGLSLILKCDWVAWICDWCKRPWRQGQVLNVTDA